MVVFLIGFVAFLGYDVWKLQQAISKRRDVESQLEQEQSRLQTLLRSDPFPSNDNVDILRRNRSNLERLYSSLVTTAANPIKAPELTRVQFRALLTQKLNALNETASEKGVTVPANFAFGFDEYLGVLPPENKSVLQGITKELLVIERLSDLLFASKVRGISKIEREPVAALAGESTPAADKLYHTTRFDLTFQCDTPALQTFLNELTKQKWFFAVRAVDLRTAKISVEDPNAPRAVRPPVQEQPVYGRGYLPPPMPGTPEKMAPAQIQKDVIDVTIKLDLIEIKQPEAKPARRS